MHLGLVTLQKLNNLATWLYEGQKPQLFSLLSLYTHTARQTISITLSSVPGIPPMTQPTPNLQYHKDNQRKVSKML